VSLVSKSDRCGGGLRPLRAQFPPPTPPPPYFLFVERKRISTFAKAMIIVSITLSVVLFLASIAYLIRLNMPWCALPPFLFLSPDDGGIPRNSTWNFEIFTARPILLNPHRVAAVRAGRSLRAHCAWECCVQAEGEVRVSAPAQEEEGGVGKATGGDPGAPEDDARGPGRRGSDGRAGQQREDSRHAGAEEKGACFEENSGPYTHTHTRPSLWLLMIWMDSPLAELAWRKAEQAGELFVWGKEA